MGNFLKNLEYKYIIIFIAVVFASHFLYPTNTMAAASCSSIEDRDACNANKDPKCWWDPGDGLDDSPGACQYSDPTEDGGSRFDKFPFEDEVKSLAYALVISFPSDIVVWVGGILTKHVLSPAIYQEIFNDGSQGIYDLWKLVRNLLNMVFIFVLLLSAFSTIFQIQKWHLRQVLLKVVIMALLVNFSWPITRVFIDLGNVLMYGILALSTDAGSSGANIVGVLADKANLLKLLGANTEAGAVAGGFTFPQILFRGVFLIMFTITLVTLSILFLTRIVVFVMLLIFSPAGFALATFPGTKNLADQWWSALIKWTFLGPILALSLFIAVAFVDSLSAGISRTTEEGSVTTLGGAGFDTDMIVLLGAIVIMWAGMSTAQQMGGSIASAVMNRSKRIGRFVGGRAWRGTRSVARGTGKTADNAVAKTTGLASKGLNRMGLKRFKGEGVSVAGLSGSIRGFGDRAANMAKDTSDSYARRVQAGRNATVSGYGAGIKGDVSRAGSAKGVLAADLKNAAGATSRFLGGKANASAATDNKAVAELTKSYKEANTQLDELIDVMVDSTSAVKMRATLDAAASDKGFGKTFTPESYKKTMDNIKTAFKGDDANLKKYTGLINSKIAENGNANLDYNYRVGESSDKKVLAEAAREAYGKMDAKSLAVNIDKMNLKDEKTFEIVETKLSGSNDFKNDVLKHAVEKNPIALKTLNDLD